MGRRVYPEDMRRVLIQGYTAARKIVVAVFGGTLILLGVGMLVLPGPAFIVIPAGIAILAIEFAWARRWLRIVRKRVAAATSGEPPKEAPSS